MTHVLDNTFASSVNRRRSREPMTAGIATLCDEAKRQSHHVPASERSRL
jgi:hypothetical protein